MKKLEKLIIGTAIAGLAIGIYKILTYSFRISEQERKDKVNYSFSSSASPESQGKSEDFPCPKKPSFLRYSSEQEDFYRKVCG